MIDPPSLLLRQRQRMPSARDLLDEQSRLDEIEGLPCFVAQCLVERFGARECRCKDSGARGELPVGGRKSRGFTRRYEVPLKPRPNPLSNTTEHRAWRPLNPKRYGCFQPLSDSGKPLLNESIRGSRSIFACKPFAFRTGERLCTRSHRDLFFRPPPSWTADTGSLRERARKNGTIEAKWSMRERQELEDSSRITWLERQLHREWQHLQRRAPRARSFHTLAREPLLREGDIQCAKVPSPYDRCRGLRPPTQERCDRVAELP